MKNKFRNYFQKILYYCLGEEYSKSSINDIIENIFRAIMDYLLHQEGNKIELEEGYIKYEDGNLIYISDLPIDMIKNEYYFREEDGLKADELEEIFDNDGDDFEPEDSEVGGVDFDKDSKNDGDDMNITDVLI